MGQHPELDDLEALRTGEGRAEDALHLRGCPQCRGEVEALGRLSSGLASLGGPAPAVPSEIEERVLWQARKRASQVRRGSPGWRRGVAWVAAAAVAIVASVTLREIRQGAPVAGGGPGAVQVASEAGSRNAAGPRSERAAAGIDVDGDGRVDILDAFALARALKQQPAANMTSADVNADGRVDRRDVDAAARRAVTLAQG